MKRGPWTAYARAFHRNSTVFLWVEYRILRSFLRFSSCPVTPSLTKQQNQKLPTRTSFHVLPSIPYFKTKIKKSVSLCKRDGRTCQLFPNKRNGSKTDLIGKRHILTLHATFLEDQLKRCILNARRGDCIGYLSSVNKERTAEEVPQRKLHKHINPWFCNPYSSVDSITITKCDCK